MTFVIRNSSEFYHSEPIISFKYKAFYYLVMIKKVYPIILIVSILLLTSMISAINLEVSTNPVSDAVITDFNEPAVFDMTIKNLGDTENFQVYSLVGVDFYPQDPFLITNQETKKVELKVMPQDYVKLRKGYFVFEYNIKNSKSEVQKEKLIINILDLKDAVQIIPKDINPKSENIDITIKNTAMYDLRDVKIKMSSPFFSTEETIPLKQFASQEISIPLDKEKLRTYEAGTYTIKADIQAKDKTTSKEIPLQYLEEENIKTTESTTGLIIRDYSVTKENQGNIKKTVSVTANKNVISYLFTTFDNAPSQTRISGLAVIYSWEKELTPGQALSLTMTTNWLYPLIILIIIILAGYIIIKYIEKDVSLRKNVSYVKTKGGEFALKVTIRIKAKKTLTNIKITDTLPHLVNLYEKYGAIAPDKVDMTHRKIEWSLESLESGQEKLFSYIIYSKVGVIGKFELPNAHANFEISGKRKSMFSNKAIYMNEQ
jgi:hypothetical protein